MNDSVTEHYMARCERYQERIAELETQLADMTQAIGLLTTLHPTMEIDSANPIGMAKAIELHVKAENQRLRDAISNLSNEFDRMHKQVDSRYVAERLQALEEL